MRQRRPRPELVVAPVDDVAQRRLALRAAHRGPAAGEDHALDARALGRLEHVVGAHDVGAQQVLGRLPVARGGAEVHDRVHVLERGLDGAEIAEVGLVTLHAVHGTAVQRAQRVAVAEVLAEGTADEAAETGDEQAAHHERLAHAVESATARPCKIVIPSPDLFEGGGQDDPDERRHTGWLSLCGRVFTCRGGTSCFPVPLPAGFPFASVVCAVVSTSEAMAHPSREQTPLSCS